MKTIKQILLFAFILNLYACEVATKHDEPAYEVVAKHNEPAHEQDYEDIDEVTTRTLIVRGIETKELKPDEIISWKCSAYIGWNKTVVEAGRITSYDYLKQVAEDYRSDNNYDALGDDEKNEIDRNVDELIKTFGFILYDGTNEGDLAFYQRRGINHRWDWGDEGEYSFIIRPDGTGLFYDFTTAEDGKKSKADDIYRCSK